MRQWVISYPWQRCWVEQVISIPFAFGIDIDLNKILPVVSSTVEPRQRSMTYIFAYKYLSKLSNDMHSLAVNYVLD